MPFKTESTKNYGTINHKENDYIKIHVYKRRWYIALVFALYILAQGNVGNTWGPISSTVEKVYDWDDSTIPLLSVGSNLMFLVTFLPMVKLLMKFGMRPVLLVCSSLMVLGTGLRCLHLQSVFNDR